MTDDQQKWERFRDAPSSDQRLSSDDHHHRPTGPPRQWIAVAILVLLLAAGLALLFTNGADPSDDEAPLGTRSTTPAAVTSEA